MNSKYVEINVRKIQNLKKEDLFHLCGLTFIFFKYLRIVIFHSSRDKLSTIMKLTQKDGKLAVMTSHMLTADDYPAHKKYHIC